MATIDDIAAGWAVRLDRGVLTREEALALDAWLKADPRHQGALIRARAEWTNLDRLSAVARSAPPPPSAFAKASADGPPPPQAGEDEKRRAYPPPHAGEGDRAERAVEGATRAQNWTRRALAAALLIAILGAGALYYFATPRGTVYASALGEVRRIALADGSQMLLNTESKAIVDFEGGVRRVRLEYGEAVFDVAPDKRRPFVVDAEGVTVTAIGTEFAVRVKTTGVAVTVTEGVVELKRSDDKVREPAQRLAANKRAEIAPAEPTQVAAVDPVVTKRRLAWRDGMLAFDGDTAASAIAEINRYNERKIVLDDPELGAKPIVGYFRLSDVDGFATALAAMFDGEIRKQDDTVRIETKRRR